jgi:beta-propeller repeat-containing protein
MAAADARVSQSYGKLPLHFEANQGQAHRDVRFLARGPGYGLYLTAGEAVLVLARPDPDRKSDRRGKHKRRDAHAKATQVVVRMKLVDAALTPLVSGLEELPAKANYFIGNDPAQWRTDVPTYAKVHYREVYPGVDLVYYGNQRQLEYDFVVAPGADPNKIVLGFKGADKLEIDAQGDLVLYVAGGPVRLRKPYIYQGTGSIRQEIAGGYILHGANRVGIDVAAYDRSRPLVIDPVILSYSTYLGGEAGVAIAVDGDGNAYVTGYAGSTDFPTTSGAFQGTSSGAFDAFVAKLNAAGSALVYSTYLGGSGDDGGGSIAVDASGNAYVTGGTSSTDFPTTAGAFQTACAGGFSGPCGDAFVTKLNPSGSGLIYSTYLGGSLSDGGTGIAVDNNSGSAYVRGSTNSANFPTTSGAFQTSFGGGPADPYYGPPRDVFVTKLNPAGSGLIYSTYLGGDGKDDDLGGGIAVDTSGNAYVTGHTNSTNFPTTAGAFQPLFAGGGWDAFVTKLDASGSTLVYSTYLGGSGFDQAFAIAVDDRGDAYTTGRTGSINFPTTVNAFQGIYGGSLDAFVTRLDATGSFLVYSTYLGGSSSEEAEGIAVDVQGNAYVTGVTNSTNFPTTPETFQPAHAGGNSQEAFVTKLDPAGSALVYSTYLGGTGYEVGFGIAVDPGGNAYVTGETGSQDLPTTPGAADPSFRGFFQDAFVAKIAHVETGRCEESAATYSGNWSAYGPETGTFSGGTVRTSPQSTATATFSFTGTAITWIGVAFDVTR